MYYISMSYYSKQTLSFDFSNPFLDPLPKLVPKNEALSAKVVGWTPTINGGCGISPAKNHNGKTTLSLHGRRL